MTINMFCDICHFYHQVQISSDNIGLYDSPNPVRSVRHVSLEQCAVCLRAKLAEACDFINKLVAKHNELINSYNQLLQTLGSLPVIYTQPSQMAGILGLLVPYTAQRAP